MSYSHIHPAYDISHLINNYSFDTLGKANPSGEAMIVDVGGSEGQVATAIARAYPDPNLKIIVQDLPETIASLPSHIPTILADRISGMPHDFFQPQPVKGADMYLYRWILHDWPDKYCVRILRALRPALKPGAMVLVNDMCKPQPGTVGVGLNRNLRLMDISMKAFNNARERDSDVWRALFEEADQRFRFLEVRAPRESNMAIVLAEWTG